MSFFTWVKSIFVSSKKEEKVVEAATKPLTTEEYEKVRTKDKKGRFVADDPSTSENEAWTVKKKGKNWDAKPAPKKKKAKKKPAAKKKKAKKKK